MRGEEERRLLLRLLDQGFDRATWHGPTLGGSIRGLTVRETLWRPGPRRHNIWELVLHTAYWKYAVRRRLTGAAGGRFPRPGSNWPALPAGQTPAAWRRDVALLKTMHRDLRDTVAGLPLAQLRVKGGRKRWTHSEMIHGVAMHDLYHAGQIQLIKRLYAAGRR